MAKPASLAMHDADGRVCAEEAGVRPLASVSSGSMFDEVSGLVAGVERIDAWLAVAKPGDRFIYASRKGLLPGASKGAARMRDLASRKLVVLIQARSPLDVTRYNYTAVRTAVPTALAKPTRPALTVATAPIADDEAAAIDALLPVLERFAAKGRPCPTDKQLAERAGIAVEAIQPTLDAMIAAHLIRIEGARGPTNRRVLILSTGAITGLAA
jgi:hypothetical protein